MIFPNIKIKILGRNNDEKGKELETLMILVVSKFGYPIIQDRVHSVGMEFDFLARNKEQNEEILCECKAHEQKISTTPLQSFIGKLDHLIGNKKLMGISLKGFFFSISGFTGTALAFYEGLSEERKNNFQIFDNSSILELLESIGVLSFKKLDEIINSITKFQLGERYIISFRSNIYLIQLLKIGGTEKIFIILTSDGHIVDKTLRDEIKSIDKSLKPLKELDLQLFEKIILGLLNMEAKSYLQLGIDLKENSYDIKVICDELIQQGVIKEINSKYNLVQDYDALIKIITILDKKSNSLLKTNYFNVIISEEFVKFVIQRFHITLDDNQQNEILKIARMFPSVVKMMLTRQTEDYENPITQMVSNKPTDDEKRIEEDRVALDSTKRFYEEIYEIVSNEYWHPTLIEKMPIKAIEYTASLKICSDREKLIDLRPSSSYFIAVAGGTIKPGEYVMTDSVGIFDMATALMHLDKFNDAIEFYDKIKYNDDDFYYTLSRFNKGICLMKLKEYQSAITCFEGISERFNDDLLSRNIDNCFTKLQEHVKEIDADIKKLQIKKREIFSYIKRTKKIK